jgi:ABC-2 type transport system permease protein
MLSDPLSTSEMTRGAISALLYSSAFAALAWWRFLRKDVVS